MEFVLVLGGVIIVLFVLSRLRRGAQIGSRMAATTNVLGKIKSTVDLLRNEITTGREVQSRDTHGAYYIGYISSLARAICKQDGVECTPLYMTTIYMEIDRLFGEEPGDMFEVGPNRLGKITTLPLGRKGEQDGQADGRYVSEPNNPPPYFLKLRAYFG